MFSQVTMMGNAEIAWNQCTRLGKQGSELYQGSEGMFVEVLQGKLDPPKYAEQLQKLVMDRWDDILQGSNLTQADVDNPQRKPATA